MVRFLQKLVRNGTATQVTLPRALLTHLGWAAGEWKVVELLPDRTVRVRDAGAADLVNAPGRREPATDLRSQLP